MCIVSARLKRKPVKGSKNWRYVIESGGLTNEADGVVLDFLKFWNKIVTVINARQTKGTDNNFEGIPNEILTTKAESKKLKIIQAWKDFDDMNKSDLGRGLSCGKMYFPSV